ncbi:unnamed protein product, partial [Ascophyllum nodosum]
PKNDPYEGEDVGYEGDSERVGGRWDLNNIVVSSNESAADEGGSESSYAFPSSDDEGSETMSQDPSTFDNMQELWERRREAARAATGARGTTRMTALPGGGPRSAALDSAAVALPSDG